MRHSEAEDLLPCLVASVEFALMLSCHVHVDLPANVSYMRHWKKKRPLRTACTSPRHAG